MLHLSLRIDQQEHRSMQMQVQQVHPKLIERGKINSFVPNSPFLYPLRVFAGALGTKGLICFRNYCSVQPKMYSRKCFLL